MKKILLLFGITISLIGKLIGQQSYALIKDLPLSEISGTGTPVILTSTTSSGAVPIGFDFKFWENTYSTLFINPNGTFSFEKETIRNKNYNEHLTESSYFTNMIAFSTHDYIFNFNSASVNYFTVGASPNKIFVVNYKNAKLMSGTYEMGTINVQVQLFEGVIGKIEIHSTNNKNYRNQFNGLSESECGLISKIRSKAKIASNKILLSNSYEYSFDFSNKAIQFSLCDQPFPPVITSPITSICPTYPQITITAAGASATGIYNWEDGLGQSISQGNTKVISKRGIYYATINENNCISEKGRIDISQIDKPTITVNRSDLDCINNEAIITNVGNNYLSNGNYISWFGNETLLKENNYDRTHIINNQQETTSYYIKISDGGCTEKSNEIVITGDSRPPVADPIWAISNNEITTIGQSVHLSTPAKAGYSKKWFEEYIPFDPVYGLPHQLVEILGETGDELTIIPRTSVTYYVKYLKVGCTLSAGTSIFIPAIINITVPVISKLIENGHSYSVGNGDAGTSIYSTSYISSSSSDRNEYILLRKNNYWELYNFISSYHNGNYSSSQALLYRTKNAFPTLTPSARKEARIIASVTGTKPPLNAIWINQATNNEETLTLTGVSEDFTALPLNLISFTGKSTEKGNLLTWKTANEKAFSHFEIQKSSPLTPEGGIITQKFEKIGEVQGNNVEVYEFIDQISNANQSTSLSGVGGLYRLKMIDLDGSFAYSKIIYIENNFEETVVGNVYPNPAISNEVFVDIKSVEAGNWTIKSYEITGKLIDTETKYLQKGINKVQVDLGKGGIGNIYMQLESNGIFEIRKIIKK